MRVERYTRSLDELETDVLVTTLFSTDRPPQGIGGLIDWRLNGFVSKRILDGTVSGKPYETVLIPLHRRLPARRLILLGTGALPQYKLADARHLSYQLGKTLHRLRVDDAAIYFSPACDERLPGETEHAVLDALEQSSLAQHIMIRWLAPPNSNESTDQP